VLASASREGAGNGINSPDLPKACHRNESVGVNLFGPVRLPINAMISKGLDMVHNTFDLRVCTCL
jgi:hypothetical protein